MTTSTITSDIDAFVSSQNAYRGGKLPGGGTESLDYDALTGTVPAGGNSVTGIAGIAASAAAITLPAGQNGNAVIIDGGIATAASTSGVDSYSLSVDTSGNVTLADNNTGNSETVTGANYLLFDGAATTSPSAYQSLYIIATGNNAVLAAMYNAAFQRVPDLPGLEFYEDQFGTAAVPDLHTAAVYFLTSPEMQKLYPTSLTTPDQGGPNDQAFVTALYSGILHRAATAAEVAFYDEALAGTLTSNGQAIAAVDRATVLEYFAHSPENQADIAGWLIDPTNGAVNLGEISVSTAKTILANDIASGTINTADFAGMPSTGEASVTTSAGNVSVNGADFNVGTPHQEASPDIISSIPNITIDLSPQYYTAWIEAAGITVNGVSNGGSVVVLADYASFTAAEANSGGAVNLFGNINWLLSGNNNSFAVSTTTIVNGWNSTDIISFGSAPGYMASAASLLANIDCTVLQGSPANPISGANIGAQNSGAFFTLHGLAINVGSLPNDSVSAIVAAANADYTVGGAVSESAFFFGQDPKGNTMVFFWHEVSGHSTIQASDITGDIELVGVQASSLTNTNFHY